MLSYAPSFRAFGLFAIALSVANADCTREQLLDMAKSFEYASPAYPNDVDLSVLVTVNVTQNNMKLASPVDTIMTNITGFVKPFTLRAIDTTTCNVASLTVPIETNKNALSAEDADQDAIVSVRLQIRADDSAIEQVEIINALEGSFPTFSPQTMPANPSAAWTTLQGNATKRDRAALIAIVNKNLAGIQRPYANATYTPVDCIRFENGVPIPPPCSAPFELTKYAVTNRRWVVDTNTGVVAGQFFVERSKGRATNLQMHQYFKINDEGLIAETYVVINEVGEPFNPVWAT